MLHNSRRTTPCLKVGCFSPSLRLPLLGAVMHGRGGGVCYVCKRKHLPGGHRGNVCLLHEPARVFVECRRPTSPSPLLSAHKRGWGTDISPVVCVSLLIDGTAETARPLMSQIVSPFDPAPGDFFVSHPPPPSLLLLFEWRGRKTKGRMRWGEEIVALVRGSVLLSPSSADG